MKQKTTTALQKHTMRLEEQIAHFTPSFLHAKNEALLPYRLANIYRMCGDVERAKEYAIQAYTVTQNMVNPRFFLKTNLDKIRKLAFAYDESLLTKEVLPYINITQEDSQKTNT